MGAEDDDRNPQRPNAAVHVAQPRRPSPGVFPLALAVVVALGLSSACSAGSCQDDDRRLAQNIPAYAGTELEYFDAEGSGCAAQLEVDAEAADIIDYYRSALREDGWDVSVRDTLGGGPEGERAVELIARRGQSEFTMDLETFEGHVTAGIRVDA